MSSVTTSVANLDQPLTTPFTGRPTQAEEKGPVLSGRRIIVARHGEGFHNVAKIWPKPDARLTPKGIEDVRKTAERLFKEGFTASNVIGFVSPLFRTKQTMEIYIEAGVVARENVHVEPRVVEPEMGTLEGEKVFKFKDPDGKELEGWDLPNAKTYGGDTLAEVRHRTDSFLNEVLPKYLQYNVLVVTHGVPSRELIDNLTGKRMPKLEPSDAKVIEIVGKDIAILVRAVKEGRAQIAKTEDGYQVHIGRDLMRVGWVNFTMNDIGLSGEDAPINGNVAKAGDIEIPLNRERIGAALAFITG